MAATFARNHPASAVTAFAPNLLQSETSNSHSPNVYAIRSPNMNTSATNPLSSTVYAATVQSPKNKNDATPLSSTSSVSPVTATTDNTPSSAADTKNNTLMPGSTVLYGGMTTEEDLLINVNDATSAAAQREMECKVDMTYADRARASLSVTQISSPSVSDELGSPPSVCSANLPEDLCLTELIYQLTGVDEELIFAKHGYKKIRKVCDTLQGELMEAEIVKHSKSFQKDQARRKLCENANIQRVAIKKVDKCLFKQRIAKIDGMVYCVEEDVVKEALVLHHLTVDNRATANYVVQFIELFESEENYYLVMEYIDGDCNLQQFTEIAHQYIAEGKLKLKAYQKIVKYIFWQLVAVLYWLHRDMKCCHLNLSLENVMLQNAQFTENDDGTVTVNPSISAKLVDFGRSELFKVKSTTASTDAESALLVAPRHEMLSFESHSGECDVAKRKFIENEDGTVSVNPSISAKLVDFGRSELFKVKSTTASTDAEKANPFLCTKHEARMEDVQYLSPRQYQEEAFDARAADMWALGQMLYACCVGAPLYASMADFESDYSIDDDTDVEDGGDKYMNNGFWAIKHNKLKQYLQINNLTKFVNAKLFDLIDHCLKIEEAERFDIEQTLRHPWYKSYLVKYKERIEKKSMSQQERLKEQKPKLTLFPYYQLQY
eukprot:CAMPEP_0197074308 /NCGR_PEP_ID=MMETSP1384-20130603/211042_1 /TAXON_ID=29189 /ORGANISM="Ammonia sp." /LENGTH=662 /DNA_ID=CAMNT_0042513149 /DNA_START=201 /DNA_END=2190 /DNA_ORIENTATION=+